MTLREVRLTCPSLYCNHSLRLFETRQRSNEASAEFGRDSVRNHVSMFCLGSLESSFELFHPSGCSKRSRRSRWISSSLNSILIMVCHPGRGSSLKNESPLLLNDSTITDQLEKPQFHHAAGIGNALATWIKGLRRLKRLFNRPGGLIGVRVI